MGFQNTKPMRFAQANLNSGQVNTGEWLFVRGGGMTCTVASGYNSGTILSTVQPIAGPVGVSGDLLIYSGAGRLNSILVPTPLTSGINCLIYDAAYAMSGGPYVTSGQRIVGVIQSCCWNPGASGIAVAFTGAPVNNDIVFNSGLCVAVRSGVASFTLTFTPDVPPGSGTVIPQ